jgi:hypothetical protein
MHFARQGHARHGLPGLHGAGEDAPYRGNAPVLVVAQGGHQHLQGGIGVHPGRRDAAQDGFEQGLQVGTQLGGQPSPPGDGVGVHSREIGLLVAGAQLDEQVEGLVERLADRRPCGPPC